MEEEKEGIELPPLVESGKEKREKFKKEESLRPTLLISEELEMREEANDLSSE